MMPGTTEQVQQDEAQVPAQDATGDNAVPKKACDLEACAGGLGAPLGQTIGGYVVEAAVGEGDLGPVYRAVDVRDRSLAALRLLDARLAALPGVCEAMVAAAAPLTGLCHPGLAPVLAVGVATPHCYVATAWLPDGSLADLLAEAGGPFRGGPLTELIDLVRQAADALAYLHTARMVHGAPTPNNMLLSPRGAGGYRLRLSDVGLLPLLERADVDPLPLSPACLTYALAPERCQGLPASQASDIYALGAVLYHIVAGRPPFRVTSLDSAVFAHVYQPVPGLPPGEPGVPPGLAPMIERCMAKEPGRRYATAGELATDLALLVAGLRERAAAEPQGPIGPGAPAAPRPAPPLAPAGAPRPPVSPQAQPGLPEPTVGIARAGEYILLRLLDEDDLGQRYSGLDGHHTPVTLRLLPRSLSADPGFRADFEEQAARLIGVDHTYLADVVATGVAGGRCFVASKPVEGPTLRTALEARAADPTVWPQMALIELVVMATESLGIAHAHNLVHGGLRPSRLALLNEGVKVCDLGLESLVSANVEEELSPDRDALVYAMAPERCQGLPLSPRSDVYALGTILYEILAGRPPFEAATLEDAVYQHIYQPLVPPRQLASDVPPAVEEVVLRCLARRPEDRYASASELAEALRTAIAVPFTPQQPVAPRALAPGLACQVAAVVGPGDEVRPVRTLAAPEELLGSVFACCKVEKFLGLTETGPVFKAHHVDLDRTLALKLLDPELARAPGFQHVFAREAPRIATLRHRYLVEPFELGYAEGFYFILMEWLPDGSLRNVLQARANGDPTWPLPTTIDLLRRAAEGLAFAHARGYVHGLVKPNNLMIQRKEGIAGQPPIWTARVSDCGLGSLLEVGEQMPSERWADALIYTMAPERAQGQALDPRSDIYALGVILYEVVTGSPPFEAKSLEAAVEKHLYAQPMAPSALVAGIPGELEQVILRCLAKRPDERYQSAGELAEALQAVLVSPAMAPPTRVARGALTTGLAPSSAAIWSEVPWLFVLDQYGRSTYRVRLTGDGVTVGRHPENDLALEAEGLQERHLVIDWDGQHATVTSLTSDAGTLLGEMPLVPQRSYPWPRETTLRLAGFWLKLGQAEADEGERSALEDAEPHDDLHDEPAPTPATAAAPAGGASEPAAAAAPKAEAPAPTATVTHIGVIPEHDYLTITPGRPAMFRVTVTNMGKRVDHLMLSVEGLPAAWVQGLPAVQLNPGGQQQVTINVNVPEAPESRAGDYPVIIKATSRDNPNNIGTAASQWTVQAYYRSSMSLRPRLARSWQKAKYRVMVHNEGNAPERFVASGEDDEQVLEYAFSPADPPTIEPGQSVRIQVRLKAPQIRWLGSGQRFPFTILAKPEHENDALSSTGQFDQRVVIPSWLIPMVIAAIIALVVYGMAAPPALSRMPYYRFLNPSPLPTRTPPATPTFAPTATKAPTLTATATFTPVPTLPPPTVAPAVVVPTEVPTVAPTITQTPTASATPTLGPECLAGGRLLIEGVAPPNSPLVLYFGPRAVGGGYSDASGRFRISLDLGAERPGYHQVEVRVRATQQLVTSMICVVPTPIPPVEVPTEPPLTPEATPAAP